jgi:peptidoglycan hydrolase-like protein with peptidoglycan-binding domain
MLQKVAVGIFLVSLFIGGNISYAHAQGLTVSQLIDLLISAGVISPDKAAAARAAAGSATSSMPGKSQAMPPACGLARDLSVGARGDDVIALQTKLGIVNPTGYFGEQTRNAVKSWQRDYGLPATGNIGPLTRAKWLERYPCDKKNDSATTTKGSNSTSTSALKPIISNVKFYQGNALSDGQIALGSTYRLEWNEKDISGQVSIYLEEKQFTDWVKDLKLGTVASNVKSFTFDMPTTYQKELTYYRLRVEGDGAVGYANVYFDPGYQQF